MKVQRIASFVSSTLFFVHVKCLFLTASLLKNAFSPRVRAVTAPERWWIIAGITVAARDQNLLTTSNSSVLLVVSASWLVQYF